MLKVSIIVSAYNTEAVFERCFDSILCQTLGASSCFRARAMQEIGALRKKRLMGCWRSVRCTAILEDVTNYGNMEFSFRSAAALGIDVVSMLPSCHDLFYRCCVRVSVGSIFQVFWTRISAER